MSFSNLWARFCALFVTTAKKGAINLDLQSTDDTTVAPTTLAAAVSGDANVSAAADIPVSSTAAIALAGPSILGALGAIPGETALGAASQVAAVAPLGALPTDSPLLVVPGAAAPSDADNEEEDSDELESLKAITGDGSELFLTVLKDLVSFAIGLGHDFETAFDAGAARAKTLVEKL
jgi:hypothetical protein